MYKNVILLGNGDRWSKPSPENKVKITILPKNSKIILEVI